MSLLNQVLQDLDDRAPAESQEPLRLATAPEAVTSGDDLEGAIGRDWLRIGIWSGVGVALILAAWVFHDSGGGQREVVRVMPSAAQVQAPQPEPQLTVSVDPAKLPPVEPQQAPPSLSSVEPDPPDGTAGEQAARSLAEQSGSAVGTSVVVLEATSPPAIEQARPDTESEPARSPEMPQGGYLPLRNTGMPPPAPGRSSRVRAQSRVAASVKTAKQPLPQPLEQARDAIERGELATAEYLLQQRLAVAPQDRAARELLIGLMLRGERYAIAMQQLDQALSRYPGQMKFVLIKARLLAQAGDAGAAIKLLEETSASSSGRIEQLQMLGALYQQQSRYEDARASYRALLDRNQNSGPAWVGLAISLDGLGDAGALKAYARALRLGDLPAAAEQYARQRMGQLGAAGG